MKGAAPSAPAGPFSSRLDVIQVDAFIPQEWVDVPLSSDIDEGNSRKTPLDGSLDSGTVIFMKDTSQDMVKVKQTVSIHSSGDVDPDGSEESASNVVVVGETREYPKSILVNGHIPPGSVPSAKATAVAGNEAKVTHPNKDIVAVDLKLSVANPLVGTSFLGPIRYTIKITVDRSNPSNPLYKVYGVRSVFPANEIYINSQRVYEYDPIPGGHGPGALLLPLDEINKSGTLD